MSNLDLRTAAVIAATISDRVLAERAVSAVDVIVTMVGKDSLLAELTKLRQEGVEGADLALKWVDSYPS